VALSLAKRVVTESKEASVDERIRHAFRLCLSRAPRDVEVRVLHHLFDQQREAAAANVAAVKQLLGTFAVPAGCSAAEFTAWYAVATALLNLDESITKG